MAKSEEASFCVDHQKLDDKCSSCCEAEIRSLSAILTSFTENGWFTPEESRDNDDESARTKILRAAAMLLVRDNQETAALSMDGLVSVGRDDHHEWTNLYGSVNPERKSKEGRNETNSTLDACVDAMSGCYSLEVHIGTIQRLLKKMVASGEADTYGAWLKAFALASSRSKHEARIKSAQRVLETQLRSLSNAVKNKHGDSKREHDVKWMIESKELDGITNKVLAGCLKGGQWTLESQISLLKNIKEQVELIEKQYNKLKWTGFASLADDQARARRRNMWGNDLAELRKLFAKLHDLISAVEKARNIRQVVISLLDQYANIPEPKGVYESKRIPGDKEWTAIEDMVLHFRGASKLIEAFTAASNKPGFDKTFLSFLTDGKIKIVNNHAETSVPHWKEVLQRLGRDGDDVEAFLADMDVLEDFKFVQFFTFAQAAEFVSHCEAVIVAEAAASAAPPTRKKVISIGISRRCCEVCDCILNSFQKHKALEIQIDGENSVSHRIWRTTPPKGCPFEVLDDTRTELRKLLLTKSSEPVHELAEVARKNKVERRLSANSQNFSPPRLNQEEIDVDDSNF